MVKKYIKYHHGPHRPHLEPPAPGVSSHQHPGNYPNERMSANSSQRQIVEYSDVSSDELSAPEAGEIESDLSPPLPKNPNEQNNNNEQGGGSATSSAPATIIPAVDKKPTNFKQKPSLPTDFIEGVEDIEDDEDDINKIINNDELGDEETDNEETDQDTDQMDATSRLKKRNRSSSGERESDYGSKKHTKKSKRNKKSKKRKKKIRSPSKSDIESISDSPLMDDDPDCLTPPIHIVHGYEKSYTPIKEPAFLQGNK